ncbi:MAG: hypothetical protein JW808_05120 [Victivallales bacterium]|nr:hypothetical protein [Victivallales bacterium]
MNSRPEVNNPPPFLSQNNFRDWLANPELVKKGRQKGGNLPPRSAEELKLLSFGHEMHRKAHELYPDGFEDARELSYHGHLENSMRLIREKRIPLFELGFEFERCYARPDIMLPGSDGGWDMIEVKSTSHLHENDIKYVAYLYHVVASLGIKVSRSYLMLLKKGRYVNAQMPVKEIFEKTDITEAVIALQSDIGRYIPEMRTAINKYNGGKQ